MAEVSSEDFKEFGTKISNMFSMFKSSAEKTHDTLVQRRDANQKKINQLETDLQKLRTTTRGTERKRYTEEEKKMLLSIQETIKSNRDDTERMTTAFKAKFGDRQLKHQDRKKEDEGYAKFTRGKTKGDQSRMDKISLGLQKNILGGIKNLNKSFMNFLKSPFKAVANVADKGVKALLAGLGLVSFIKFIEGLEKASKWFGENPTFGEVLSSGLANLIGFFTGATEEERKKMALDIKEKFKKIKGTILYVIDSFAMFFDTMEKLFTGDFEGVVKNFEKDGSAFKFFTALGLLAIALPGLTGSVMALSAALVPFAKIGAIIFLVFDLVSEAVLSLQKAVRYGQAIIDKITDPFGPSIQERYEKGLVKDINSALDIIKKGKTEDAGFIDKMDGFTQEYNLSNFLADPNNKSVIEKFLKTGSKDDIEYINKLMKDRKEGLVMPLMDSIKNPTKFHDAIIKKEEQKEKKRLEKEQKEIDTYGKKITQKEIIQLVPDESTSLSQMTRFDGTILAVDKLTETLQDYFRNQMNKDIKVNNTSINNTQVSPKQQVKFFTPSKGKGPYANFLS